LAVLAEVQLYKPVLTFQHPVISASFGCGNQRPPYILFSKTCGMQIDLVTARRVFSSVRFIFAFPLRTKKATPVKGAQSLYDVPQI
jgi:hypothetical protein